MLTTRQRRKMTQGPVKCESCFVKREFGLYTLPWSPQTHWMYARDIKSVVLYLILVGRSPDNIFSRLGRDIWFVIIRYTIPPWYVSPDCRRRVSPYCDECMPRLMRGPQCQRCFDEGRIATHVTRDIRYEIVGTGKSADFVPIPAVCIRCQAPMYCCDLHSKIPANELCYWCVNQRKLTDGFKSSYWVNIPFMDRVRRK